MKHQSNLRRRATIQKVRGLSLVELLIVITILGIVTFIAIPNVVQVRRDSEDSLAISRAQALNLAAAAMFQARGTNAATTAWQAASSDEVRYGLLKEYLSFAPATFADFKPSGYSFTFDGSMPHRTAVVVSNETGGYDLPY